MHPRRRELRRAVGLALLCATGALQAAPQPRLLEVWLNGQRVESHALLQVDAERYFAPTALLAAWRLKAREGARLIDGVLHHPLHDWQPQLEAQAQRLDLQAPPADFEEQSVPLNGTSSAALRVAAEPLAALSLDYLVNSEHDGRLGTTATLLDLRALGIAPRGSLRHSGVWRAGALPEGDSHWLRLDSAWQHADPDGPWRATLGDTLSCGGELAPTMRLGGAQWQTDFGLRPELLTHALPSVAGSAQLPSAIDLLVNGQPAASAQVGPGSFRLDALPAVSGAGEIRVVQRDVLGVEQVRVLPYYASPRLLRAGLSEHCAEAGRLRLDYGLRSNHYAGHLAAYALRHGLSDTLTVLARAEAGRPVRALHLGAHLLPQRLGVLSAQWSGSHAQDLGAGQRWRAGFERVESRGSIAAGIERADARFRHADGSDAPARRATLFGGWAWGAASWSAGQVWQRDQAGRTLRLFSSSVQRRLGRHWQAALSTVHREGRWSAALLLTRQLDDSTAVAARAQAGLGAGLAAEAQRSEPPEGGLGWRVQAGSADASAMGALGWLGEAGRAELQAARLAGGRGFVRASASGGLLWLGDDMPRAGRPLGNGAIALVEIDALPGVGVQLNHRDTARTDAQGRAWLQGLNAWEDNIVGIASDELPMDVALQLAELRVRPPAQAVVRVAFPARRSRAVVLLVQRPDGEPIAPGSRALHAGDTRAGGAPFGHGGRVYLDAPQAINRVRVQGPQGLCELVFLAPTDTTVLQPEIGPLVCTPQERP